MNKIMTLFEFEFKRIYKLYLVLIGVLFAGNLGVVAIKLHEHILHMNEVYNLPMEISVLKNPTGIERIIGCVKGNIYHLGNIVLGISVLICLLYAGIIWYRDYILKSKTIYTLFMLPQKRFNIYLAKLLTVVMMIYGLIVSQFLFWFIDLNIVKIFTGINSPGFTNIINDMIEGISLNIVSPYIIDFLMIDVIGVILAVIVIFTAVLIERSYKKIGIVLGGLYIVASIFIYFSLIFKNANYSDKLFVVHVSYYIVLFITSLFISNKLINEKAYL
ncbi:hypothetical protein CHF27_004170 [Romboutsia maritimum]|uniref:Uncharacterized protein n=1 Tax=Romboutsia maritimum TaxID=2020948 RepID=A0A371IUY6_9FIRM|nr:hypothetical protein [Romboutsia maritimum]RDY24286.1 hypothetical protein CHF27_004170 [Romboutsia maritimum]